MSQKINTICLKEYKHFHNTKIYFYSYIKRENNRLVPLSSLLELYGIITKLILVFQSVFALNFTHFQHPKRE